MDQLHLPRSSKVRKRQHYHEYARPRHVSFDERSDTLATSAMESFGRLGVESSKRIDQAARGGMVGRWEGN